MTRRVSSRRWSAATRRGSALILVLVMTLSLAGLAVSAVLLTSTASLAQRYYDKAKDYKLYALSAIGLVKSRAQRDTLLAPDSIPRDTAYRALTASTITDASGTTNATIKVNAYATYTGDTAGTYIPFLTLMAQAYDTLGVKSVQRLDMQSEAFSRYMMFVDSFPSTTVAQSSMYLRGRVHGNRNWVSAAAPGTNYADTLTVTGTISGTSNYTGNGVAVTTTKRVRWPTSTSLSLLPTLASNGNLSFAQVGVTTASFATAGGVNVSGDMSGFSARSGTALRFRPVDVNNNGVIDASEGFFMVFDLATGMDTANLRVDPVPSTSYSTQPVSCPTASSRCTNSAILNQCGLLATISGRKEFFPVTRFRESWVRKRVRGATAPVVSDADTTKMRVYSTSTVVPNSIDTTAIKTILGYGAGYSRCFPAGSPYLMLTERFVDGACTLDSNVAHTPLYAWGGSGAGCGASVQYGGQDTTFTANVRRCMLDSTGLGAGSGTGRCYTTGADIVTLGSYRAFGGTSTAAPPATVIQAVQKPYLWPISTTYNSASRGVIYASSNVPLFVSDTVRGFVTLYAKGRIVLVDDLVYDRDPTAPDALCRNFLGVISDTSIKIANSALNFPRRDPTGGAGTYRFWGTPNFTIHGALLALSTSTTTNRHGTISLEDSSISAAMSPTLSCNGTNSSGGCYNHTGSESMKIFHQMNGGSGTGLVRNLTLDPCMAQQTNRRPPFFPLTGRYLDYKWYEADPRYTSTWAQIKTYLATLRGTNRAVP